MAPYEKCMKYIITNKRKIPENEISTMLANYSFKDGVPKKLGDPGIPTIPCSIKTNYVKCALCDLDMKDVITNKRKIPEAEISTMLSSYSFKDGIPKKIGDPGILTIPCSIKRNYVKTALCDLGVGVSVMPFSLYKRLDLNKLSPTKISLKMADKSTTIPIGICEDVLVVVANVTILTDFVILDMPEDDNMSVILGRPFLNTAAAVVDCNKSKVTFHINGNEHTVHFPKKQFQANGINVSEKSSILTIGSFQVPLPTAKKKYDILIMGDMHIPIEVT